MSDVLALGREPRPAAWTPLPVAPRGFWERFRLDYDAERATGLTTSDWRNRALAFEAARADLAEHGVDLPNPYDGFQGGFVSALRNVEELSPAGRERAAQRERAWDEAVARLRAERPELAERLKTAAELRAESERRARELAEEAERAAGFGGGLGGFLGTAAAIFTDPVQVLALPLGAGRLAGGVLRQALKAAAIEGSVAAGVQAAVEAEAGRYRAAIGAPGDSMERIAAAAAGGAVIGGGLRALLAGVERALARGAVSPAEVADVQVARAAAWADELVHSANPGGAETAAAHVEAVKRAVAAVARGEAPQAELPLPPLREMGRDVAEPAPVRQDADATGAAQRGRSGPDVRAAAADDVAGMAMGLRPFTVYAPTGRSVVVEPRVVELESLVVSHGPDGRPNPAYPHAEGLQPRERDAAPSQDQVRAIAANLIPERLRPNVEAGLGAPIIGPDLAVEGGNGRVAALTLVYRDQRLAAQRAAYRAMVEAIDPAARAMKEPVLVSVRLTPLTAAERAVWARELNLRTTAAASTVEEAKLDAEKLRPLMPLWRAQEVDAAANADLVRRFLDALGPEERRALLDDRGRLTALGRQRIERAVLRLAYGDELGPLLERLLLAEGEGYKAVAGALRDVAPQWAALRDAVARGEVDAAMDTTAQLAEAVRWLDEARVRKVPVRELLAQLDLDRPPPTELARAWLALWHTGPDMTGRLRARERIAEVVRGYVDEARKHLAGPNLFGMAPAGAGDVLAAAARKANNDAVAEQLVLRSAPEPDGGPPTGQALRQAETARAREAGSAEAAAAELLEARRELAARDVMLAVDEAGTTRSARELLDEVEAAEAEAAAAATCLVGGGA